jgi:hypothetical protein
MESCVSRLVVPKRLVRMVLVPTSNHNKVARQWGWDETNFFRVLPLEKGPKIDSQPVACNRISLNVKLLKRFLDNSSTRKILVS